MTWEYDAAGNILNRKEYAYTTGTLGTPTRTVNYGYGDADWGDLLTSYNGMTITYDEIGNPLTGRNGSMTWEHGRQLASMGEWQFTYDANGMRRTRTDTESGDIYRYFYTGGQLKSMRAETDEAYVDYTFYYDAGGNPLAASYFVDYWSAEEYTEYMGMFYYVTNAQGDVTALVSETGELLVTYDYDAWGKPVRTDYYEDYTDYGLAEASQFVSQNPFRYRGYVYDTETGLYYLQSRYYDPEVGRFINADGYTATGQGLTGNNMFAYCGNNPVMRADYTGEGWFAVCLTIFALVFLSGCMEPKTPPPTPYTSADDAAAAFAEEIYSTSYYVGFEYASVIYSITENGITTYGYTTPTAHDPHESYVDNLPPEGTAYVAYIHTHPNSNEFSPSDRDRAGDLRCGAYMIGPNLQLQYYNYITDNVTPIRLISPSPLTAGRRAELCAEFQDKWDYHISKGCDFGCASMKWPRS